MSLTQPKRNAKALLVLWLLAVCACAVYSSYRLFTGQAFYSNVMELLPEQKRDETLQELNRLLAHQFHDRLLVLLRKDGPTSAEAVRFLNSALTEAEHFSPANLRSETLSALQTLYRPFSQQLLNSDSRSWLTGQTPTQLAQAAWRELLAPVGRPRAYAFNEDPFNLGGAWLSGLKPETEVQFEDDLPLVKDAASATTWYLISARLAADPFELAPQYALDTLLTSFREHYPEARVLTSGLIFHAMEGTRQARHEISTVGLGSLLGIILLTVWIFRSARSLLLVGSVLTAATLAALTGCLLVFERVHLLTLAFGSTLLGVAVDYVYHFLLAKRARPSAALRRALGLGVASSTIAYLMQWLTPFPGLHQMALFCAAGLLFTGFSLLALAPFGDAKIETAAPAPLARLFYWLRKLYLRVQAHRALAVCAAGTVTAGAVLALLLEGSNDSLLHLNTSPVALLEAERQVQTLMDSPSSSRFFLVQGSSETDLLANLHSLEAALVEHRNRDAPDLTWRSLATFVPQSAQQARDRALVQTRLYGEEGALQRLAALLQTPLTPPAAGDRTLTLATVAASPAANLLPPVRQAAGDWFSPVLLNGRFDLQAMRGLATDLPGVRLVDNNQEVTDILQQFRRSIGLTLVLSLLVLTGLFALVYRWRCLRIIAPLGIAIPVALALAATSGITLFHLIALLLVIGIGIDTSTFYLELGFHLDSWLAATVSSATSLLAFGLLALSEVPVLHQFGSIVLFGIFICWLVTPVCHRINSDKGKAPWS